MGDLNEAAAGGDFLLVTFIVTEEGEQQHPMDAGIAKLNLGADGLPDQASMNDLCSRVVGNARRKVAQRRRVNT